MEFERNVLRRIIGLQIKTRGTWKKKKNEEVINMLGDSDKVAKMKCIRVGVRLMSVLKYNFKKSKTKMF